MSLASAQTLVQMMLQDSQRGSQSELTWKQHAQLGLEWLIMAQDQNGDGGVAAYYSLITGWAPSFIETTGYIIGTFLHYDPLFPQLKLKDRAIVMGEFLLKMQMGSGAFLAYPPETFRPPAPIIFNAGQDLLGVADLFYETKQDRFEASVIAAADFLISQQTADGSWVEKNYDQATHAYHSRVGWALAKAHFLTGRSKYLRAARLNLDWTVGLQQKNGWFKQATLPDFSSPDPIMHTLSYTIEGLMWGGCLLNQSEYLEAGLLALRSLAKVYDQAKLWATYDHQWQPTSRYVCLTGAAQISSMWWLAGSLTGDSQFLDASRHLNSYLKQKQVSSAADRHVIGAMAGSDPIMGDLGRGVGYCRAAYPNWATKFWLDALYWEHQTLNSNRRQPAFRKGSYVFS